MNFKEWKKESLNPKDKKTFWYWRNKAIVYFDLKPGEVIHHLMETEEQKEFNRNYYERWGFDLNGEMKYCVKMTKIEHDNYHASLRKGKHNSKEHNKRVSESLKNFYKTKKGKEIINNSHNKCWENEENHRKQSERVKKYFSNPDNRKKLSESMTGKNVGQMEKQSYTQLNVQMDMLKQKVQ